MHPSRGMSAPWGQRLACSSPNIRPPLIILCIFIGKKGELTRKASAWTQNILKEN